jgi:hypothetical protein
MLARGLTKANTTLFAQAARCFSSDSVTYDFKDLIRDPEQKGQPIYSLYRLEESQMPMKATTNKDELMAYLRRMI